MFNNRSTRPTVAQVRPAKKRVHYTVSTIGGAEELAQWKLDRARLDAEWEKAQEPLRAERRRAALSGVVNQNAQISPEDRKEIQALTNMENEQSAIDESRRRVRTGLAQAASGDLKSLGSFAKYADPAPTLSQKLTAWASRLWRTAFPE